MTPSDYQSERKLRGTQTEVAKSLDIQRETLSRRETGAQPISREAWLALLSLPHPPSPAHPHAHASPRRL